MPTDTRDFRSRALAAAPKALRSERIDTIMLNVGRRCELACAHCHHRCSAEATESMSQEVMHAALRLADVVRPDIVDVTGGSPELWPLLPDLVTESARMGLQLRLRTNLMAIAEGRAAGLAEQLARHQVIVLASVPGGSEDRVAPTRGAGVFERSLCALRILADLGYGRPGGPRIELASNPATGLPAPQAEVQRELADALEPLGMAAACVRVIANVPLGRHRDRLVAEGALATYLGELADAFDARALQSLPCRATIEVGWNGMLFDCDFNLAAKTPVIDGPRTVFDAIDACDDLVGRRIAFAPHCFACTIGTGSG